MDIPYWANVSNRVALVTGCGSPSGIGIAIARALGQSGATVVITATSDRVHERAKELTREGIDAHAVVADLGSFEAAQSVARFAQDAAGPLSILISNAGMTSRGDVVESGTVTDIPVHEWHDGLRRNLDTAFFMSRALIPSMREQTFGRIVFVTSVTGPLMAMRGEAAYAAAKAGMVGLMRAIAIDEAPFGITANAVAPGWINTGAQTDAEAIEGGLVPLARSGEPAEVAAVVASLCFPGAAYVTGQLIAVDGGNSVGEERSGR